MKNTFNPTYHHFGHENKFVETCLKYLPDNTTGRTGVWFVSAVETLAKIYAKAYAKGGSLVIGYLPSLSGKGIKTNIENLASAWGIISKQVKNRLIFLKNCGLINYKTVGNETYIVLMFDERPYFEFETVSPPEKAAKVELRNTVELPVF